MTHTTFYRHGGGISAIPYVRRQHPFARGIAGQARNDGLSSVLCPSSGYSYFSFCNLIRSILSVIFSGKVVFSSNLMLLYFTLADRFPIKKVFNRTV